MRGAPCQNVIIARTATTTCWSNWSIALPTSRMPTAAGCRRSSTWQWPRLNVPGADTRRRVLGALISISDRISNWRSAVAEVLESGQQNFKTIKCADWQDFTRVIEGFDNFHIFRGHCSSRIRYLENHRELMDYPGARRRGLPIGSGNTAATCKTLFTVRMKRSGARWKEATAAHVINLRALALNDRWEPALQLTLAPLRKAVRVAA